MEPPREITLNHTPYHQENTPYHQENPVDMDQSHPSQEMAPQQYTYAETLDVTISVGFIKGIIMKEASKFRKDRNKLELDTVKAVVTAVVPSTGYQAEGFLSSHPIGSPKTAGDALRYNAMFPLKGKNHGSPTRLVMPGLMKRDNSESKDSVQYKRQTVELLITLVFGNEAFNIGKSTLLVTGEEVRTKQGEMPIDTTKSAVMQLQKKTAFPMKRMSSLSSNKLGSIAPTSFKYDRRRRKYQIESDAVMRVYMKVTPTDPYKGSSRGSRGGSVKNGIADNMISTIGSHYGEPNNMINANGSFAGSYMGGYPHSSNSSRGRDYSRSRSQSNTRSRSSNPRPLPLGLADNSANSSPFQGSMSYSPSPPTPLAMRQRSQSVPRQRPNNRFGNHGAYGGSAYGGYNNYPPSSSRRSQSPAPSRGGQNGHEQYGGSAYGLPRKQQTHQNAKQYGGSSLQGSGVPNGSSSQRMRSQSPHVYTQRF